MVLLSFVDFRLSHSLLPLIARRRLSKLPLLWFKVMSFDELCSSGRVMASPCTWFSSEIMCCGGTEGFRSACISTSACHWYGVGLCWLMIWWSGWVMASLASDFPSKMCIADVLRVSKVLAWQHLLAINRVWGLCLLMMWSPGWLMACSYKLIIFKKCALPRYWGFLKCLHITIHLPLIGFRIMSFDDVVTWLIDGFPLHLTSF